MDENSKDASTQRLGGEPSTQTADVGERLKASNQESHGLATSRSKTILFIALPIIALVSLITVYLVNQGQRVETNVSAPPISSPTTKINAQVTYIVGSAWKIVNERKIELKENDVLTENDELVTDESTRVILSFDDGSIVRIDESSTVLLLKLATNDMEIHEDEGSLFARVLKDATHTFTVVAGTVRIESVGTSFAVENKDEVRVKVFENQVKVAEAEVVVTVGENEQWQQDSNTVSTFDTETAKSDEFITWNLEEDQKVKQEKLEMQQIVSTPSATSQPTRESGAAGEGSISLNGKVTVDAIRLEWQVYSVDTAKGFKILQSAEPNPTFPEDLLIEYVADPAARSRYIGIPDEGSVWHFRVCQAISPNACGVYSNDVELRRK